MNNKKEKNDKKWFFPLLVGLAIITLVALIASPSPILGTVFCIEIIILVAFYLFQFGNLSEFSFEAFSAKAKLIKQKVEEAEADVKTLNGLKDQSQRLIGEIDKIKEQALSGELAIEEIKNKIFGLEGDFIKVKKGLVEMEYLQYAGRNKFPNPYHERIMDKLNELVIIALPDVAERSVFIAQLQTYTKNIEKNK